MRRLLIVDDEPSVLRLLVTCFERAGYEVYGARGAHEGQELCGRIQFDALLCDVIMQGADGHQMARWAATRHPQMLVVLMTGYPVDCTNCPVFNGCHLLRKPFFFFFFVQMLENLLP